MKIIKKMAAGVVVFALMLVGMICVGVLIALLIAGVVCIKSPFGVLMLAIFCGSCWLLSKADHAIENFNERFNDWLWETFDLN
ncbi:MAG: hypothetical protein AAB431_02830 [Patescibacteria group bacterium]